MIAGLHICFVLEFVESTQRKSRGTSKPALLSNPPSYMFMVSEPQKSMLTISVTLPELLANKFANIITWLIDSER